MLSSLASLGFLETSGGFQLDKPGKWPLKYLCIESGLSQVFTFISNLVSFVD